MKPKQAPYHVEPTNEFNEQVEALKGMYPRIDQSIMAITWALKKDPREYDHIVGDYYTIESKSISKENFPDVKVMYRILADQGMVTLMAVE